MSTMVEPALREIVTLLPREGVLAMAGINVNPDLTIIARPGSGRADFRYFAPEYEGGLHPRVSSSLLYFEHLRSVVAKNGWSCPTQDQILFQVEDLPVNAVSLSWEAQAGWSDIRLIPDLYYFQAGGYEDFNPALDRWEDRRPSIVWRGSSTGICGFTLNSLDDLPRYKMCSIAQQLGAGADVALTALVQALDPEQERLIQERLLREGLIGGFVPMEEMARHRFILDIDGNSNSWNFMQKLRLGCCVLRVDSLWRQWFSDRLVAWEHYVPVAADLSDLVERAEWCFAHGDECSAIAARGRQFAIDMKFADEVTRAARVAFGLDPRDR